MLLVPQSPDTLQALHLRCFPIKEPKKPVEPPITSMRHMDGGVMAKTSTDAIRILGSRVSYCFLVSIYCDNSCFNILGFALLSRELITAQFLCMVMQRWKQLKGDLELRLPRDRVSKTMLAFKRGCMQGKWKNTFLDSTTVDAEKLKHTIQNIQDALIAEGFLSKHNQVDGQPGLSVQGLRSVMSQLTRQGRHNPKRGKKEEAAGDAKDAEEGGGSPPKGKKKRAQGQQGEGGKQKRKKGKSDKEEEKPVTAKEQHAIECEKNSRDCWKSEKVVDQFIKDMQAKCEAYTQSSK